MLGTVFIGHNTKQKFKAKIYLHNKSDRKLFEKKNDTRQVICPNKNFVTCHIILIIFFIFKNFLKCQ